jgi:folate-binding protein YgfZ
MSIYAAVLDRGVVKVAGEAARTFLNGLVTNDVTKVTPQAPCFAALLTPQGKIITDFIIVEAPAEDGGGFFLDCPRALAANLAERLTFYKLRAKITIEDLSAGIAVMAVWGGASETDHGLVYPDPRVPALGQRVLLPPNQAAAVAAELGAELTDAAAYEAHRITLGVPRGGLDFIYSDAFPHEADMDQLAGVDFGKGCYVGQEVVSRMQHRGSARNRVVGVTYERFSPEPGAPVLAGGKQLGTMGSGTEGRGLAMLRLDRLSDAIAAGAPIAAGGIALHPVKPTWARFPFPGDTES